MPLKLYNKTPIKKGWSKDLKYLASDKYGHKYLLRISDIDKYEKKINDFNKMKDLFSLGIYMPTPIEFGTHKNNCYSIQSWIDGIDAEKFIPYISKIQQYNYGIKAGKLLKTIHSLKTDTNYENWEIRFNRKIDTKIELYKNCNLKYPKGDLFIDYIKSNRHLLKNRPTVLQHGDYHIGNMVINKDNILYIIDFGSMDYGDPWEEFNRIVWSAKYPAFASGIIDGYFNNNIPETFWKLLILYISNNTLSSLAWSIEHGDTQITIMKNQAKQVLEWFDDLHNPIPTWYNNIRRYKYDI